MFTTPLTWEAEAGTKIMIARSLPAAHDNPANWISYTLKRKVTFYNSDRIWEGVKAMPSKTIFKGQGYLLAFDAGTIANFADLD